MILSPGLTASNTDYEIWGRVLSSHGIVALLMQPTSTGDWNTERAEDLKAALGVVKTLNMSGTLMGKIDVDNIGFMGHSMGGGGTLELAARMPTLQAAVPLQPWDIGQNFSGIRVPTMIIGAQADFIAPVAGHSEPFYEQVPATTEKAYLEVAGADHLIGLLGNPTQARYSVAWLKRYVDDDTRYDQFICPPPSGPTISEYRNTCPP
jgi:predicted dienelactone hydrolase